MQPNEFDDAKLLWKMFYAEQCLKHARAAAEHILNEKLEEDNPLFYPLITAVHVNYGKPFGVSRGVGRLEEEMIPPQHLDLHHLLLKHRNQVFAHADAIDFEVPDFGQANQVCARRSLDGIRLFGTEFQTRYPMMPSVIDLCDFLLKKTSYHVVKLFNRYTGQVPSPIGDYVINVYDQAGDFFLSKKSMMLKKVSAS